MGDGTEAEVQVAREAGSAPGGEASAPPGTHKILGLVVHGMGDPGAGNPLRDIVKNFYPLIRERIDRGAGIRVRPVDEAGPAEPAEVRISFRWQGQRHELHVREVHWAEAFVPPSLAGLLLGLGGFLLTWLRRRSAPAEPNVLLGLLKVAIQGASRLVKDAAIVAVSIVLSPVLLSLAVLALAEGSLDSDWGPLAGAYRRLLTLFGQLSRESWNWRCSSSHRSLSRWSSYCGCWIR